MLLVVACKSSYRDLRPYPTDTQCLSDVRPEGIETNWYTASVDVIGKHMSGLLLIKRMDHDAFRAVFTSETGLTFFDLGFTGRDGFEVHKIIPQLDKKPVIHLLREDFSLLLGLPFREKEVESFSDGNEVFFGWSEKNKRRYFITDRDCASLRRLEVGSGRKRNFSISLAGNKSAPEEIEIKHYRFDMVMTFRKIDR